MLKNRCFEAIIIFSISIYNIQLSNKFAHKEGVFDYVVNIK